MAPHKLTQILFYLYHGGFLSSLPKREEENFYIRHHLKACLKILL